VMKMTMKALLLCNKMYFVLSEISRQYQSTGDVFCNPKMLSNIRHAKVTLTLYCNAGKAIVMKKEDLKGYGTIWWHRGHSVLTQCAEETQGDL